MNQLVVWLAKSKAYFAMTRMKKNALVYYFNR